jgi:hypothetical protein
MPSLSAAGRRCWKCTNALTTRNDPWSAWTRTSRQLLADTRAPLPCAPGRPPRAHYEYQRGGTANVFLAFEPLAGRRTTQVSERRRKVDWAQFVKELLDGPYAAAEKVVLVMDNLNIHTPASL